MVIISLYILCMDSGTSILLQLVHGNTVLINYDHYSRLKIFTTTSIIYIYIYITHACVMIIVNWSTGHMTIPKH